MNLRLTAVRAVVLAVAAGTACGAMAFADDDARRAILDLRAQVKTLDAQVKALEEQLKNTQMNFVGRRESLQQQNRMLTGKVEELTNALTQEQRSTRDLYAALDQRLSRFEPQNVVVNGETVSVDPKEKAAYDAAVELLKNGDYKAAQEKFRRFAADWDQSAYRADAIYWRGSCLFATEQYKTAIDVQNQLIRLYPKHPRVPDAMISVASCQAALGNVKAAAATLNKVVRQFPDSDASKTARERLKALK